jgi:hypothetical protein
MNVQLLKSGAGDWIGLYVDGKLKMEGHSLRLEDVLESIGIKAEAIEGSEYLEEFGNRCPDKWPY